MPIPLPNLDDRTFDDLVAEVRALIPRYAPGWTDHNASDPGITMLELFAWLAESLIYRNNRVTDASTLRFLHLLGASSTDLDTARQEAVSGLKMRWRAVSAADFEALILGDNQFAVARAKCLPETDLTAADPTGAGIGHVSVIVVAEPDATAALEIDLGLPVAALDFGPRGQWIATAADRVARIWDVASGAVVRTLQHDARVQAVALDPEGRWLATGAVNAAAHLWDVHTGDRVLEFSQGSAVTALAFAPGGGTLASGGIDGVVRLWDPVGRVQTASFGHGSAVRHLCFDATGARLAVATAGDEAAVWDVVNGTRWTTLEHGGPVHGVAFSPDGQRLATASADRLAGIWSIETGELLQVLHHASPVNAVAFNHDGRLLATGSDGNLAQVWELRAGSRPTALRHNGSVHQVVFSPDGRRVATGCSDGKVRLWTEQLSSIWDYLDERRLITCRHHVVGPTFTGVRVRARVVASPLALSQDLVQQIDANLRAFFNPYPAGGNGQAQGWPFGRHVYVSEVHQVIEETSGVDHVDTLSLEAQGTDGSWSTEEEEVVVPANDLVLYDGAGSQITVVSSQ